MQNTHPYAKAGVMIREALTAQSRQALMGVTPGQGLEFLRRVSPGGETSGTWVGGVSAPQWVRLVRSGNTFIGYSSSDGTSWQRSGVRRSREQRPIGLATRAMITPSGPNRRLTTSASRVALADSNSNANSDTYSTSGGSISFVSKGLVKSGATSGSAHGVSNFGYPTSLELGPTVLYAVVGRHFIFSLDQSKLSQPTQIAVTGTQVLKEINSKPTRTCNIGGNPNNCQYVTGQPAQGGRQVTGLVVRQGSTSGQIELYVSHSDPRIGENNSSTALSIDTYSGAVTRLILGPNTSTPDPNDYSVVSNQDLVVGLPRSRENHSVNGMDFGPDGWLYISSPGHTNYGQPSTFFSNLPEYYLSAAVLRL
ncbi:MAG: hypothetical protein WKH64_14205, partial [Chloroflexia bacterium]